MSKYLKLSKDDKPLPTPLKKHLGRRKLPRNSNYLLKLFASIFTLSGILICISVSE